MARMSGKVRREFDAASAVTLRNAADGAEVADAAEAGVALNLLADAYWDNKEQADGIIAININVSSVTRPDADEVYALVVEVATDVGFSSPVEVARLAGVPSAGFYELFVSSVNIEKLVPAGAKFIRIKMDVTGADTDANITYGAWMTFLHA